MHIWALLPDLCPAQLSAHGTHEIPLAFVHRQQIYARSKHRAVWHCEKHHAAISGKIMQADRQPAQQHRRNQRGHDAQDARPEDFHIQSNVSVIVPVHHKAVAHDHRDRRAHRAAKAAPADAQGNRNGYIKQRHEEIDLGAELMLILRPLDFNAQILNQWNRHRRHQQQRDGICAFILAAAPCLDKRLAHEDEAREHKHQQHELDTPDAGKELRERAVALAPRDEAADLRHKHAGDRGGNRHVIAMQLAAHAVYRGRRRAGHDTQNRRIDRPVDLIDDHIQEDEEREAAHFAQELEVKPSERKAHVQLLEAEIDARHIRHHAEYERDNDQRNAAHAHQKQRQHHNRIEHRADHADHPLEEEAFLCRDVGRKHTAGEGHRDVDHQQRHQHARSLNLCRRELGRKNVVNIGHQNAADHKAHRRDHQKDDHEHAVDLRHAILSVAGVVARIIAHICAAQTKAHQGKIGDKAVHQRIQAVFALPQQTEHDRRIDKGNERGNHRLSIRQQHARLFLIHDKLLKPGTGKYAYSYIYSVPRLPLIFKMHFSAVSLSPVCDSCYNEASHSHRRML